MTTITLNDEQAETMRAIWQLYMDEAIEPYNEIADKLDIDESDRNTEGENYDEDKDPVVIRVNDLGSVLFPEGDEG